MRNLTAAGALFALAVLGTLGGHVPVARAQEVDCRDYCGQRAALRCDSIDSWECGWYIVGCLAGCNIRNL